MSAYQHLVTLLLAALSFSPPVLAWTNWELSMSIVWPPVINSGYITQNGHMLEPNANQPVFPCANVNPPASAGSRTEFPLTGAHLQYQTINSTNAIPGSFFIVDIYLGQFSNDANASQTGWSYLDTLYYQSSLYSSDTTCTTPVNMTYTAETTPEFDLQLTGITPADLIGVDVTLGSRIVLFDAQGNNQEEMYQCSYLTLVGTDRPVGQYGRGLCNPGPNNQMLPSIPPSLQTTASSTSGLLPTAPVSPSATSTPVSDDKRGNSSHIGIAVGASLGAAVLFLGLGFWVLCRRKAKKAKCATVVDVKKDADESVWSEPEKKEKKEKEEEKSSKTGVEMIVKEADDTSSSRDSIHSEQLPAYRPE